MLSNLLDFDKLAEDNVRTLNVPPVVYKRPVAIILVGIPASGKTTLVNKLAERFPLAILREEDMTTFLSPRATIFKRSSADVFQLAAKSIELLIKRDKSCIYDANVKTNEQRMLLKKITEDAGGVYQLVFTSCPKEICYERLQKHNLDITRGDKKGFILDKDLFDYEMASTRLPTPEENHIVASCDKSEDFYQIVSVIEKRLSGS